MIDEPYCDGGGPVITDMAGVQDSIEKQFWNMVGSLWLVY